MLTWLPFTLDRIFPPRRTSSKKRDHDGTSASLGTSRSSETKSRTSPFSLSRLLPSHRRTKSQLSLDSDTVRSDAGACGSSPPHPTGNVASSSPPLMVNSFHQLRPNSTSVHIHNVSKSNDEMHQSLEGIPQNRVLPEETQAETSADEGMATADNIGVGMVECPVCLVDKPKDCFREISTCHHRCCSHCLREYFRIEIMESRLAIACPECSELFHPNDIRATVQDSILFEKYEDFMVRRVLAMDSDTRWCPAPDCGYAVIATGCAGCPKLKCEREGCNTFFCYHCKQYWHPNQTCDAARAERSPNIRSASVSYSQESNAQNEIKSCPRCGAYIVKMDDGSCNHMTCAVCGAGFCWLCMKEISDLHYLSPSGCTFWGRKPWSRKKKILWQLGTLVGAPVGITLVAGIAVPAMIIGIPVWVGRKIHYHYDSASKHKRNLAVTGGVAASILAAPIIAGLAVGIGVPILLAYVYGVVPFSLCRSGGCGVTTTNTGGVRFEFDEHDENNTQGPYAGDNHSIETVPNVANPSIAPSIGDASLGMTNSLSASGSHMDRAGVLRDDSDRDSSSHRAIAGNSNNGSLCSATYSAQHHKLEVHADISEHAVHCERSSMGGESYSMSFNDDASTKALAGSIVSHRDKDGISLCSRHFDGAAGHLAYPEETSEKEDEECASSSSGGGQQQMGSCSCPTSPHLRKASPAPSEDARSTRGKKCTRFMDEVSEIESKVDCASIESIVSNNSISQDCDGVSITLPSYSTLSLTTTTSTTNTVLASCESVMSEGRAESIGNMALGKTFNFNSSGRMKAESTSVLLDCAESRSSEMGATWKKGGSASREDINPTERSVLSRRKGSSVCNREHRSQPGNLSDISEMKGMPTHHTAGCSHLAVIDTSCENVFIDKAGHTKVRLMSASSCSSSSGGTVEFLTSENFGMSSRAIFEPCPAVEEAEMYGYDVFSKDTMCSLSDINIRERKSDNTEPIDSRGTLRSQASHLNKESTTSISMDGQKYKSKFHFQEGNKMHCEIDKRLSPTSLYKQDMCFSGTSSSGDSSVAVSPLPDVELPAEADVVSSSKCQKYMTSVPGILSCQDSSIPNSSQSISPTLPCFKPTDLFTSQNTDCHNSYSKKPLSVYELSATSSVAAVTSPDGTLPYGVSSSRQISSSHFPTFPLYSEAKPRKAVTVIPLSDTNSETTSKGSSYLQ